MFIDPRDVREGLVFESDICIVGAGAAGITLAQSLAAVGFSVDLLESGSYGSEPLIQAMTHARIAGVAASTPTNRLRYLGGTTNHWGGWCRALEAFDFQSHAWIPDSGWPIGIHDLAPYYERACEVLAQLQPCYSKLAVIFADRLALPIISAGLRRARL